MRYAVEACLLSDVGCHRTQNEGCLLYVGPSEDPLHERRGMLALVADGMGGHQAGQVASQLAVDVIRQDYYERNEKDPTKALRQAFIKANSVIYKASISKPDLQGMGTTCSALVLKNGQYWFAHVGDSRLYWLRNGKLLQLTEDHTMVMDLVNNGLIRPADAQHHPDKNIITRALGTRAGVEVSVSPGPKPVQIGDYYILCSDGLHDLVDDNEIRQSVLSEPPYGACAELISLAKERGGYDNISVGILAIRPVESIIQKIPNTREFQVETN